MLCALLAALAAPTLAYHTGDTAALHARTPTPLGVGIPTPTPELANDSSSYMASPPGMLVPLLAHGTSPAHLLYADAISSTEYSPDPHDDYLIDALLDLLPVYFPLLHECAIYFSFSKFPKGVRFRDRAPPHRSPRDIERAEVYAHAHTRVINSRPGFFEPGNHSSRKLFRRFVPACVAEPTSCSSRPLAERDGSVMGGFTHPRRRAPPPSEVFKSLLHWYFRAHIYVALAALIISVCHTHPLFLASILAIIFRPVLCSPVAHAFFLESIFELTLFLFALTIIHMVNVCALALDNLARPVFYVMFSPLTSATYYITLLASRLILLGASCVHYTVTLLRRLNISIRLFALYFTRYCFLEPGISDDGVVSMPFSLARLTYSVIMYASDVSTALLLRLDAFNLRCTVSAVDFVLPIHAVAARRFYAFSSTAYMASYFRHCVDFLSRASSCGLLILALAVPAATAQPGDEGNSTSRPPPFDGTRTGFMSWLMIFTAWVAWKQTDCVGVMEGIITPPVEPAQPINPAVVDPNHADIADIRARYVAWQNDHNLWSQQITVFNDLNTKLYGAILQAVPDWLRTSLYLVHRNDGRAALESLRNQFDSHDANDHAANMARLQARYIDPKADLSENDLRRQYDAMMTAAAGIRRTGNAPPNELALIAMFDNSLPISYSQLRQLVRRSAHKTLADHFDDYMAQVRAELAARAPAVHAFSAFGSPAPAPAGATNDATGGGRSEPICLRCGKKGHSRGKCKQSKRKCKHCGGDHLDIFCPNGPGGPKRDALPQGAFKILRKDASEAASPTPQASSAAAPSPAGATTPAPAPAASPSVSDPTAGSSAAHAAAAAAAAACDSPEQAGQAYIAAMKSLGFGLCTTAATAPLPPPSLTAPEKCSSILGAMVDTMATYWVVNDRSLLAKVTNPSPGFSINTANGAATIDAVGTAFVCLFTSDNQWVCYEVANVLFMPSCTDNLYSTRVMHEHYRIRHDVETGYIRLPATQRYPSSTIKITDDGASYSIPVCFAESGAPIVHRCNSLRSPPKALSAGCPAIFPASISGTPQSTLYRRLGFPDEHSWRHVSTNTTGHGLPPNTVVSTTIPVTDAIMRGRTRRLPFIADDDKVLPAPGAIFYGDHCGPMIPSHPHRFIGYSGYVDAGSGYGRPFPCHGFTALSATSSLQVFTSDVAAKMKLTSPFKPCTVRTDQGSAFVSHHFKEFLSDRQIHQSLACTYTPQQNSYIERFWGSLFTLARILLASANLPPTFHPFAVQTAAWILNRLPRQSRGNQSPFFMLTKAFPDLSNLYCFGCLCTAVVPPALRAGDKHLSDRGQPSLYLGPSEISPGHVIYLISARSVVTRPHIQVWEDQFPGLKGVNYIWFPDTNAPSLPVTVPPPQPVSNPTSSGSTPSPPVPSTTSTVPASSPSPSPDASTVPSDPEPVDAAPAIPDESPTEPDDQGSTVPLSLQRSGRNRVRSGPQYFRSNVMGNANVSSFLTARLPNAVPLLARASAVGLFALMMTGFPVALPFGAFCFMSALQPVDSAFADYLTSQGDCLIKAALSAAGIYSVTVTTDFGDVEVPKGYKSATTGPRASYWIAAINLELHGLIQCGTWIYVTLDSLPKGANVMRCHYVFTIKRNHDGSIERFKARLVADGNSQKWGIDFDRVFSTVVKTSTLRLLLIIAAANGYNLSQVDIKQAYLQATLTEDLYMMVPEGLPNRDEKGRRLVCKLKRSIYGLKQAGRAWGLCLSTFLTSYGFQRSHIDTCLYCLKRGGSFIWLAIYVDDIVCMDNDSALRDKVVKDLDKRFTLTDKGVLTWVLGVKISRNLKDNSISLSQELYIYDLITRFAPFLKAKHSRSYSSPLEEGYRHSKEDMPQLNSTAHDDMKDLRPVYMSLIGGLIWVSTMTRHDMAFAVSQLARALTNPGRRHFDAAIRVLLYLQSTSKMTLSYCPNKDLGFQVFVDSDWSANFSCSGAYFMFMGCPFHWFSKMQHSISLSSAEAEYFGAMLALKELIFFRELLFTLGQLAQGPTTIFTDSKSAVDLSHDHVGFRNTKHILRAAEFLRDNVVKQVAVLAHLLGRVMIADILTKSPAHQTFTLLLKLIKEYSRNQLAVAED